MEINPSPAVRIFVGHPLRGDEAAFLRVLCADLSSTGALIFANFLVGDRQIDFLVVTPSFAALLELKNHGRPIFGDRNGRWQAQDAGGNRVDSARENPYQQTREEAYALSDAMKRYGSVNRSVPAPIKGAYYNNVRSFVCVYPEIHPNSAVTPGDNIVAVKSYPDVLAAIRSRIIKSSWTVLDWERFALDHLHLTAVTLDAAIDPKALAAQLELNAYRQRLQARLGSELPPLIEPEDEGVCGTFLVRCLQGPLNYHVFGPSGSTKSFHMRHTTLALAASTTEIPLLVDAKRYHGGDFWHLLKAAVSSDCAGDLKQLLLAMELGGFKPVLLIDAINECSEAHREDLMKGALAFALHYNARVIVTSQERTVSLGGLQVEPIALPLPDRVQKRRIYAYHAGIAPGPDLDQFCEGFTNAYDLRVAGRCHAAGQPPRLRVELYDRYVNVCLPSQHAVMASALLRHIAGHMGQTASFVISRDACEAVAEQFLRENDASIAILDAIFESPLVQVTADSFSFEHELLFNYEKAQHIRRELAAADVVARELRKPRNAGLIEFVLPRYSENTDIRAILEAVTDVPLLQRILSGVCGEVAQAALRDECEELVAAAIADLPNVSVEVITEQVDVGKVRVLDLAIGGTRSWTPREALISELLAHGLEDERLQDRALELIDATEAALRAAITVGAKSVRLNAKLLWSEVVRLYAGVIIHGVMRLPCTTMLSSFRSLLMDRRRAESVALRQKLAERVYREPTSAFSLIVMLEDSESGDVTQCVDQNLDLIGKAWQSGGSFLQMSAMNALMSMRRAVGDAGSSQMRRACEMLAGFTTSNTWIESLVTDAQSCYDVFEAPVSFDAALSQLREVIDPHRVETIAPDAHIVGVIPMDWITSEAYSYVDRMFSDTFQGVYFQAYEELSNFEKAALMRLAAQKTEVGFHTPWILHELLKFGDEQCLTIFARFAAAMDTIGVYRQDEVASFVLGIRGCARWSEQPPSYAIGTSSLDHAWATIGEALFWLYRDESEAGTLRAGAVWDRLEGESQIAAGVVLYELHNARHQLASEERAEVDLATLLSREVYATAHLCVEHRTTLERAFGRYNFRGTLMPYLIERLGQLGELKTLSLLQGLADDPVLGHDALRAIEAIQRRSLGVARIS